MTYLVLWLLGVAGIITMVAGSACEDHRYTKAGMGLFLISLATAVLL